MSVTATVRTGRGLRLPVAVPAGVRMHLASTVLFAVAFLLRASTVLASTGGYRGVLGDDSPVYYAGAAALVHGRMPYRDFTLVHPPLLDLALTPFAALGAITDDSLGYVLATVVFELLGAVAAVLVVVVCRRLGLDRRPSLLAGAFYAVWYGAVVPDMVIRLEGLGTVLTLVGLIALTGRRSTRNVVLGGAAFGAAASVKIWGVVPLLVLLLWWVVDRRTRRSVVALLAGAVGAVALACGPFLVAAPAAMWRMVVTDQVTRAPDRGDRLRRLLGLARVAPEVSGPGLAVVCVAACAVLAVVVASATRVQAARPVVAICVAEVVVLAASPSNFPYYTGFVAATLAITVGAAAQSRGDRRWDLPAQAACLAVAAAGLAATLAGTAQIPDTISTRAFPRAVLSAALAGVRCPTPDSEIVLIRTNTLSRTLADGCVNWIDVSGRVYDVDKAPEGSSYPRTRNVLWQRDLGRYLRSGDVLVLSRPLALGLSATLRHELERLPLVASSGGYAVYRVRG